MSQCPPLAARAGEPRRAREPRNDNRIASRGEFRMSNYSGKVSVGGPPDVRELPGLVITKVAVGPMDNNCYLLRCRDSGEQLLIDAANDPDTLLKLLNGPLERIVTTHQHWDHWQALGAVVRNTGARTTAHHL